MAHFMQILILLAVCVVMSDAHALLLKKLKKLKKEQGEGGKTSIVVIERPVMMPHGHQMAGMGGGYGHGMMGYGHGMAGGYASRMMGYGHDMSGGFGNRMGGGYGPGMMMMGGGYGQGMMGYGGQGMMAPYPMMGAGYGMMGRMGTGGVNGMANGIGYAQGQDQTITIPIYLPPPMQAAQQSAGVNYNAGATQ